MLEHVVLFLKCGFIQAVKHFVTACFKKCCTNHVIVIAITYMSLSVLSFCHGFCLLSLRICADICLFLISHPSWSRQMGSLLSLFLLKEMLFFFPNVPNVCSKVIVGFLSIYLPCSLKCLELTVFGLYK